MKKKLKLFFLILTIAFVTTGFKTPETNVSEHFVFTLENDTVVFPTNVPDFLDATNGSFGKIDPEMTMLAECQYYESNMMYRVSFFNPTEDNVLEYSRKCLDWYYHGIPLYPDEQVLV